VCHDEHADQLSSIDCIPMTSRHTQLKETKSNSHAASICPVHIISRSNACLSRTMSAVACHHNVRTCMCVCVTRSKSARRAVTTPLVAQLSFLTRLKGPFLWFKRDKNVCSDTRPRPIFKRQNDPSNEHHVIRCVLSICEKT